jgi:hypothetical protein
MIPLPFIAPKAGYPIYRLKLDRLQAAPSGRLRGTGYNLRGHPGTAALCDAHHRIDTRGDANAPSRTRVTMFLIAVFAVATACSLAGGAIVRRAAYAGGAVVPPRPDRWHASPTPTLGGFAIVAGTIAGFAVIAFRPDLLASPFDWGPVPTACAGNVRRRHPRRSAFSWHRLRSWFHRSRLARSSCLRWLEGGLNRRFRRCTRWLQRSGSPGSAMR